MAPEMLRRACISLEKADVWSFGVVMFEVMCVVSSSPAASESHLSFSTSKIPYADLVDVDVKRTVMKGGNCIVGYEEDFSLWKGVPVVSLMRRCCDSDFFRRPNFKVLSLLALHILNFRASMRV